MYLLKLSFRPWRLAPMSQVFSAIAVGFLLMMIGFLFWMQQGLKTVVTRMQGEQVITAYLHQSVGVQDERALLDKVRESLEEERVGSSNHSTDAKLDIKLVNAKQFMGAIKGQYPDLVRELEDLGQDTQHIVPRYISVSGILPRSALDTIQEIKGIESVESSKDRYHHIVAAFSTLRWVARILMGGICFALLTGLIHLARMNSYLHADAISLLRFWGAGAGTLVGPGTVSGVFVGLIGGVIACAGWLTVGAWLAHHIRSFSAMLKGMPLVSSNLALSLLLTGCLMGLLAGLMGSVPAQTNADARSGRS